ncbi:MAG: hypothetical protein OXF79_02775 [Chloroflexi bacterium]|nr:hypothetical protein [Chloroflexota bacterium]
MTSANIDELVGAPLPDITSQLENLVQWAVRNLGDDKLGTVTLPKLEHFAAVVGTVESSRVDRLLRHAADQGLIDMNEGRELALTPRGWEMADPSTMTGRSPESDANRNEAGKQEVDGPGATVMANCNKCGGDRNAYVGATHAVPGSDGEVSWETVMEILECGGCSGISVRRRYWFSEWENVYEDPLTGQLVRDMPEEITCWPAKQTRVRPDWGDRLGDGNLRQVMEEVYVAIDHGLVVLAAIGARTLLDRAMLLEVGDQKNGFRGKLDAMVARGHMGPEEMDKFLVIADAGSAAAHRAHVPSAKTLDSVLTAVEALLYRLYVLPGEVKAVKASTPKRQPP